MTLSDAQLFGVFVGSWVVLIVLTMFILRGHPAAAAKGLPATFGFMGLLSFLSMLARGSLWMALTVAAMPGDRHLPHSRARSTQGSQGMSLPETMQLRQSDRTVRRDAGARPRRLLERAATARFRRSRGRRR
jgi:hypothetical protein